MSRYAHGGIELPQEDEGPTRRVFAPRPGATAIAALMLLILLALGTWQARRYGEASALIGAYAAQHDDQPPVERLDAFAGAADDMTRLRALHFRRAKLAGTLRVDQAQLLTARYVFGRLGYGVVVPLAIEHGPKPAILAYLGWVPEAKVAAYLEELRATPQRVVTGRLQVPTEPPETQPAGTFAGVPTWQRAVPAALLARIPDLEPRLMLQAGEQAVGKAVDPERVPVDGYAHPVRMLPSKHAEYAATWYGLALTLIAVWIALSTRKVALGDQGLAT